MINKSFWKAFIATFLLCIFGLVLIAYPTSPQCAVVPEDVGPCSRVERLQRYLPATILVAIPMSIFVGVVAGSMKPAETKISKNTKGKK